MSKFRIPVDSGQQFIQNTKQIYLKLEPVLIVDQHAD